MKKIFFLIKTVKYSKSKGACPTQDPPKYYQAPLMRSVPHVWSHRNRPKLENNLAYPGKNKTDTELASPCTLATIHKIL